MQKRIFINNFLRLKKMNTLTFWKSIFRVGIGEQNFDCFKVTFSVPFIVLSVIEHDDIHLIRSHSLYKLMVFIFVFIVFTISMLPS